MMTVGRFLMSVISIFLSFIVGAKVIIAAESDQWADWSFDCDAAETPSEFRKGAEHLFWSDKYTVARGETFIVRQGEKYKITFKLAEQMICDRMPRNDLRRCEVRDAPYFLLEAQTYNEDNYEKEETISFATKTSQGNIENTQLWFSIKGSSCILHECDDDVTAIGWNALTHFGLFQENNNIVLQSHRNGFRDLMWQDDKLLANVSSFRPAYEESCAAR